MILKNNSKCKLIKIKFIFWNIQDGTNIPKDLNAEDVSKM